MIPSTQQLIVGQNFIYSSGPNIGVNNSLPFFPLDISGQLNITQNNNITLLSMSGNNNNYLQTNILNQSTGGLSSSDLVCTNNTGSETGYYIDLGINGSNYTGQYVGNSGDGYLYSQANDFYLGNVTTGKRFFLFDGVVPFGGSGVAMTILNNNIGIHNNNPISVLDVSGQINSAGVFVSGNPVVLANQTGSFYPPYYRAGQFTIGASLKTGHAIFSSVLPGIGYAVSMIPSSGYNSTTGLIFSVSGAKTTSGFFGQMNTGIASIITVDYICWMFQ